MELDRQFCSPSVDGCARTKPQVIVTESSNVLTLLNYWSRLTVHSLTETIRPAHHSCSIEVGCAGVEETQICLSRRHRRVYSKTGWQPLCRHTLTVRTYVRSSYEKFLETYNREEFFISWFGRSIKYACVWWGKLRVLYTLYNSVFCSVRHGVRWGQNIPSLRKWDMSYL